MVQPATRGIQGLLGLILMLAAARAAAQRAPVDSTLDRLPLRFEANRGQVDSEVQFVARAGDYQLLLKASEAVMVLHPPSGSATAIRVRMLGATERPRVSGIGLLPGLSNYFIGQNPTRWRTRIPTYQGVKYERVYSGIDVIYYGRERQVEWDWLVAPGASPASIRLRFEGVRDLHLDPKGGLVLQTNAGEVRQSPPWAYQEKDGVRVAVQARYLLRSDRTVGLQVGRYDRKKPLTIDPVLLYASYLGGSAGEFVSSAAMDGTGNVYLTGLTNSIDFPTTPGALQDSNRGGTDAFVTIVDPTGSFLLQSTYFGGTGNDAGSGITLDPSGNIYVAGSTYSGDFPVTTGAFQLTLAGQFDAFVFALNASATEVLYSSFLGGSEFDYARSIAVDKDGSVFLAGETSSTDFPVSANAFQQTLTSQSVPLGNAFVAKLDASCSILLYSTYLGGTGRDFALGVAVDGGGSAFVVGGTSSRDFPTTEQAFQRAHGIGRVGGLNAFIAKVSQGGDSLVYSTFLGGTGDDTGHGISVDLLGNAYLAGETSSLDFPTTPGSFQPFPANGTEAFVTELDSEGRDLVYSSFLGGNYGEQAYSIAIDSSGNAYVAGVTYSTDFPTTPDAFQPAYHGNGDAFLSVVKAGGAELIYSTFLGGSSPEQGLAVAVNDSGAICVAGQTSSTNFPSSPGAFQRNFHFGGNDGFVVVLQ